MANTSEGLAADGLAPCLPAAAAHPQPKAIWAQPSSVFERSVRPLGRESLPPATFDGLAAAVAFSLHLPHDRCAKVYRTAHRRRPLCLSVDESADKREEENEPQLPGTLVAFLFLPPLSLSLSLSLSPISFALSVARHPQPWQRSASQRTTAKSAKSTARSPACSAPSRTSLKVRRQSPRRD